MTNLQNTPQAVVWVAIDVAKDHQEALIEVPGWRSRKKFRVQNTAEEFRAFADFLHSLSLPVRIGCLRSTNASVRGAVFVLKWKNAGRRKDNGAAATDGGGSPADGSGVCGQWHAAKRVLPQSRFRFEHAGSPSEEEKEEKQRGGWPGRGGIGHREVADRARAELWVGRGVSGWAPDRSAARF